MQIGINNRQHLAASQHHPEQPKRYNDESGDTTRRCAPHGRRPPSQPAANGHHDHPANQRPRASGNRAHYEIDHQPPERRPDHHPLCQRHQVVALPQHNPSDHKANACQHAQFQGQNQQPRQGREVHRHLASRAFSSPS